MEEQSGRRRFRGLSPWNVIWVALLLGLAVLTLFLRESAREEEKMSGVLMDKANALIWALEAGTRTWLGFEGDRNILQPLIDETAKQPGIVYLAVIDADGKILAHSDRRKLGETAPLPARVPAGDEADWRRLDTPDGPVFEVHKVFAPVGEGRSRDHGGHHGGGRMKRSGYSGTDGAPGGSAKTFALVGLDQRPYREAMEADLHNSLLTAAIVAALGFAGVVSVFWAQSYRRSRRMLMDTQAMAAEVVTCLPLGLITCDTNGKIEIINDTALAMLERKGEKLIGMNVEDVRALQWREIIASLAKNATILEREAELITGSGRALPIKLSASPIRNKENLPLGYVFILVDIGEVKQLQSEIQRNERLAALGNLATGVAHEIRNPLSTIKGLATYMAKRMPEGERERNAGKTIIYEINRLNGVVSELLEFARPPVSRREPADMNDVAARALRLADADIHAKGIVVDFVPDHSLPQVRINQERLARALLNLFLNAVQAMDQGGTLRVSLAADPERGDFSIAVTDTGHGMPEEIRKAVFNPYFTTKPNGTGLGLAIVHQIVSGHGGAITVKSAPGSGSTFTIHLPVDSPAQPVERT